MPSVSHTQIKPLKKPKRKPLAEINVVPYIDVMLVLLVVFMISAPLLTQGILVDLPKERSAPLDKDQQEPLIVSVNAEGDYFLKIGQEGESPKPLVEILEQTSKILRVNPQTPVLVWGDTKVPYGQVINLMAALQESGVTSVGLVTEPPG